MKLLAVNQEIMRIKKSHETVDNDGLGYDDLYIHPCVELPEVY